MSQSEQLCGKMTSCEWSVDEVGNFILFVMVNTAYLKHGDSVPRNGVMRESSLLRDTQWLSFD